MRVVARLALVLFSAAVLQRGLFSQMRVADVALDVFLLLTIAAGMTLGADRGAVVGFFAGLSLDLLVQTPLGMSALVYCIVGFALGTTQASVLRANRLWPRLLVAGSTVVALALYAIAAEGLGLSNALSGQLLVTMAVLAVVNALLYPVARRVVAWSWPTETALRPALR